MEIKVNVLTECQVREDGHVAVGLQSCRALLISQDRISFSNLSTIKTSDLPDLSLLSQK